jgi:hypothetical protein
VTTSRSRGSAADSSAGGGRAQQLRPHALGEHALLADGQRGAIVGPRGDLVWMCAPFWDSEPVFDSLVGGRGVYAISPHDPAYVWGGSYEPGSLIWSSRWVTDSGITQCREALARPADDDTLTLLRRVEATDGPADLDVLLAPSAGFTDRGPTRLQRFDADGRSGWTARLGDLHLRWTGAADSEPDSSRAWTQHLRVAPGEHHDLILEISPRAFTEPPPEPDSAWSATRAAWAAAAVSMTATIAPRDAAHSHAVLTGLTSPGGGMVAAATTSLPERSEAGRNYDYRYVWIRDQCYAGQAAAVAGSTDLLDAAVSFVGDRLRADGARMVPAYTTRGEAVPGQRPRSSPPGYPGAELITGNWVNRQFQLDAFGEALLLLAAAAAQDRLDLDGWQAVEAAVAAIEHRWTEPDAGIWELDDHRWTHSRLTCVAGLRTVAAHAPAPQAGRWSSLADAILADTARTCLHPDGYWHRGGGRRRPPDGRDPAGRSRPTRGRAVRLPVPPRSTTTRRCRRSIHPLRVHRRPRRPPRRTSGHRGPPVRTQPCLLWSGRTVHRRIRYRAATTPGEPPPGFRPRTAARDGGHSQRDALTMGAVDAVANGASAPNSWSSDRSTATARRARSS